MRRILASALLTSALYVPASYVSAWADPLQITPDTYPSNQRVDMAPPPAPAYDGRQRYANAQPNLGGGFIEFLFGGAPRPSNQAAYQPAVPDYQTVPPPPGGYGQGQSYTPSSEGD